MTPGTRPSRRRRRLERDPRSGRSWTASEGRSAIGRPASLARLSPQKSWFSPSKASDTEWSLKMRRIESVSTSAQVSRVMRSGAGSTSGTVSVTTMSPRGESARVSKALPAKRPCVATACTERAPRADDVVDDHGDLALHVADDGADLRDALRVALLLHQRVGGTHPPRER